MNRAFTLIELSIVLVILGLLAGGILTGRSLIRASEVRTVATEFDRHITAIASFRGKYLALPGDITNATSFWGAADPTPATCKTTISTTTATCNGDGNANIDSSAGSNEYFRFWQHLVNAGLLAGDYTGVKAGAFEASVSADNAPTSKLSEALWHVFTSVDESGGGVYPLDYGNAFLLGRVGSNSPPRASVFTPPELWNLDTKLDDGLPGQGRVIARNVVGCTTSNNSDLNAAYELDEETEIMCAVYFKNVY